MDSDLNGASPQFTLTCNSTGGPATTVTWTRDSVTVTEGNETVLNDPVSAQYTHTLTVTGGSGMGGLYTCTVANVKPSEDSATYTVRGASDTVLQLCMCLNALEVTAYFKCCIHISCDYALTVCVVMSYFMFNILPPVASAPTNLMAVQEGPTSIRVSWSPPTPLGDTTGYRIYYSGGSSGSVNVSDGSTDNYLLTGLQNGDTYTISIVTLATASSQLLPSERETVMDIGLGTCPCILMCTSCNPSCSIHGYMYTK